MSATGDVAFLSALGQSMIVVGSYTAACALLEDRSANTSDRQHSVMADLWVPDCSSCGHRD